MTHGGIGRERSEHMTTLAAKQQRCAHRFGHAEAYVAPLTKVAGGLVKRPLIRCLRCGYVQKIFWTEKDLALSPK